VADNGLEALVTLGVAWLPQLDGAVGTGRDENLEAVDVCMNQLADLTFMRLRRFQLDSFVILALLNKITVIDALFLIVEDLS